MRSIDGVLADIILESYFYVWICRQQAVSVTRFVGMNFETSKPLVTYLLQLSHTYSDMGVPPNSAALSMPLGTVFIQITKIYEENDALFSMSTAQALFLT